MRRLRPVSSCLLEVCEAVLEHCPDLMLLHFPTNGYLTDKVVAAAEAVVRHPRRPEKFIVTVSTDGDEETNDRIRGIEADLLAPTADAAAR